MTDAVDRRRTDATAPAASATAPPGPTASPRCRARSRSRPTSSADGFLWGATLRSPHPSRPHRLASTCRRALEDHRRRGRHHRRRRARQAHLRPHQPGPAGVRRATSCATSASRSPPWPPTTPRPAAGRSPPSSSSTRCSTPLTDPERAVDGASRRSTPTATSSATSASCAATRPSTATVVVEGTYELGMQDQAFLGLEAALAIPDPGGAGVELYVATQWLHEDRKQIAACLGLPEDKVRLMLGGVGGAFGAREDISLQVHTCLLALRTGRPVRMAYSRDESFLGHVHRHPARIWMRHHADARRPLLGGSRPGSCSTVGAYASTSSAVLINAVTHAQGPYRCDNAVGRRVGGAHQQPAVRRHARLRCRAGVLRPRGPDGQARRGAAASTRSRSGCATRCRPATGSSPVRSIENVAPVARCIRETAALPLPDRAGRRPRRRSDAAARRRRAHRRRAATSRRGIGWGVAIKNLMYSEGFDDYSTARVPARRRRGVR